MAMGAPVLLLVLINVTVFAGTFLLVRAVLARPITTETPAHRRVAGAMGLDRQTVFENPHLAPPLHLAKLLAGRLHLPAVRRQIRADLDAAGNPSGYTVDEYLAICLLSAGGLGATGAFGETLLGGGAMILAAAPVMAVIGFAAPMWAIHDMGKRRVSRISKQLPYTLDLIALVMQAGSTFPEAVETLIRDDPEEDLNQELRLTLNEMNFGTPRATALANLAERIPLDSLRSIVGAVNQAESLGTPLASILKLQAEMLRMHRGVRAEKLSASASLRILIPSMLILLAVVLIVFAPLIVQYYSQGSLF